MSFIKAIGVVLEQVVESSKRKLNFQNLGYLPRWLILLFDILICFAAIFN